MPSESKLAKLRKKVAYCAGTRRIMAEAELVWHLALNDSGKEALELSTDSIARARNIIGDVNIGDTQVSRELAGKQRRALAHALRAAAFAFRQDWQLAQAAEYISEAADLFEELELWVEYIDALRLYSAIKRGMEDFVNIVEIAEKSLAVSRQIKNLAEELHSISDIGKAYAAIGDMDKAYEYLYRSLEESKDRGTREHVNAAVKSLIAVQEDAGNYREALNTYSEHFKYLTDSADQNALMTMYRRIGILYIRNSMYAPAIEYLHKALQIALDKEITSRAAELWHNLAVAQSSSRNLNQAFKSFSESLKLHQQLQHPAGEVRCLVAMARIAERLYNSAMAQELFDRAALVVNRCGLDVREFIETLRHLLERCADKLDCTTILRAIDRIVEDKRWFKFDRFVNACSARGFIYEKRGELDAARAEYKKIIDLCDRPGHFRHHSSALRYWGKLEREAGNAELEFEMLSEAQEILQKHPLRQLHVDNLEAMYENCRLRGKTAEAFAYYRQMAEARRELSAMCETAELTQLYAEYKVQELEHQRDTSREQADILESENQALKRELSADKLLIEQLKNSYTTLQREVQKVLQEQSSVNKAALQNLTIADIKTQIEGWQDFEQDIRSQDQSFLQDLSRRYPELTATERRVCALIRLNNTSKDLCRLLNVSTRTLQSYRYRIRKKIGIDSTVDLNTYLADLKFDQNE